MWEIASGRRLTDSIGQLGAFSDDGRYVASVSEYGNGHGFLALWDLETGSQVDFLPIRGRPTAIAFGHRRIAVASSSGQAYLVDVVE